MWRGARILLLSVLLFSPWTAGAAAAADLVPAALVQKAQQQGSVLVIVEVGAVASVPEGALATTADVAAQRAAIRAAQEVVVLALHPSGARIRHRYQTVPLLAIEATAPALGVLATLTGSVVRVIEDVPVRPVLADSVPLIGAPSLWGAAVTGAGVVIAVLDTGVDGNHPFLAGRVVAESCYATTISGQSMTTCPNGLEEQHGTGAAAPCSMFDCFHGTHVAGIAAGDGVPAGQVFSGVAPRAGLVAIQVFSRFTRATTCAPDPPPCALAYVADLIAGLERVYALRGAHPLVAVNLSVGGGRYTSPCGTDPMRFATDNLLAAGIAVAAASGNDGYVGAIGSPACIPGVVSVGRTTKLDQSSPSSNTASFLTLLAPGSSILSSTPGGGFVIASGTSMATPHVTGAFALLRQAAPSATVTELLVALQLTGVPINDKGFVKPRIQVDQAHVAVPAAMFVGSLYEGVLRRPPDHPGALSWTAFLRANCNPAGFSAIAHAFFDSSEFRAWPLTLNGLVAVLYRTFLGRDPEPAGLAAWAAVFRQVRVTMALGSFIPSPEFQNLVPDRKNANLVRPVITRLYVEVLGRQPEPAGLAGWVNYVVASGDLEGAALAFITSSEFEQRSLTFAGFVRVLYRAFLGREPDPAGAAAWELVLRQHLLGVIDSGFIPSGEFQSQIPVVCAA